MSKASPLRRLFGALWNGITRLRRAVANLLFLLLLVLVALLFLGEGPEPLPAKAALLLDPVGVVVDQKVQADPLEALFGEPSPAEREVLLRDMIDAIRYAKDDPAINALVMELDYLAYLGISKTQEVVSALEAFRDSGKPVVAVGDYFTQDQYLLASHADTVMVHPFGGVALEGFSSYRNYFREALEKLSVNMHVFKAGEHKSMAEPFLRDDMSPGEKEITGRWLEVFWQQYTDAVEAQRELAPGAVNDYVNGYAGLLAAQGGDAAKLALAAGLVDRVADRAEANDFLVELVGAADDDGLYEAVPFETYVSRRRPLPLAALEGDRVAVITAEGEILPGDQPPGVIGGDSLAGLILDTADTDGVAAIVLRVDSGGGSVFASEIIRQQLLEVRDMGLPVVVSMGSVAASGGYYIAAQADQIWATPATITGSIGVFAAFPTFEDLLQRLGVHTDGLGTTDLAGSLRLDRPLNPELADALRSGVDFTYREFLQIVAQGREMSVEAVDSLAQGRVWSASDALEHGLIDRLGSLDDAIAAAAAMAGLEDYSVEFVEPYRTPREVFLQQLADSLGGLLDRERGQRLVAGLAGLLQPLQRAARELEVMQDPRHLYMRCLACGMTR